MIKKGIFDIKHNNYPNNYNKIIKVHGKTEGNGKNA